MPADLKPIQHDQMIGQKLGGYTMTENTAAAKPEGRPPENGLEERKNRPKVSKPRPSSPKTTSSSATHGAPARVEDEPEQAWR